MLAGRTITELWADSEDRLYGCHRKAYDTTTTRRPSKKTAVSDSSGGEDDDEFADLFGNDSGDFDLDPGSLSDESDDIVNDTDDLVDNGDYGDNDKECK
ncbi:hypothetical protein BGX26_000515 [Mortierella sp. AD094]|nr:hypothetical protein BGX26_000515 [Mortierella sp. AD094]